MDTDDLELDDDALFLPPNVSSHQQSHEAAHPTLRAAPSCDHAEAPTRADEARSGPSIPGPAGASGLCQECLPHIDGGGYAVKLKDSASSIRGCMTAQCFKAHPRLECGMYMQLSDVAVLHVSEGQSYACIVPQNIVDMYATRPQSTEVTGTARAPAHHAGNTQPVHASTQGTITSSSHARVLPDVGEAPRYTNGRQQGHAQSCAPSPAAGTLRDRIAQLQQGSQTPAFQGPLGQTLRQSQPLHPAGPPSGSLPISQMTPTCSQQDGLSPPLSSAAPCSVSTQAYSNAASEQNGVKVFTQKTGGSTAQESNSAQPTTHPRRAWVHQLKADVATIFPPDSPIQQSVEQHIAQLPIQTQHAQPGQGSVQPQQPLSVAGGKTATLLSRLRGHTSSAALPASMPAGQVNPAIMSKSLHPKNHFELHRQQSACAQQQQAAYSRRPLAPMNQQQSGLPRTALEPQRGSLSQQRPQFRNLSKTQQLALESAGLGHSQSSTEL